MGKKISEILDVEFSCFMVYYLFMVLLLHLTTYSKPISITEVSLIQYYLPAIFNKLVK